ncbi:NAD-dependent epimerase/dehydratase family protein [Streptomyces sp. SID5785]|uniref:SDR family oxidoreductase n=1 Tax=Streptomyces sp. SID5785 TaxID=2690309 RepID=UPI0013616021|nr:SDR family oxidoreductase [Streptomyces sp. SID5785]MZD03965.1 NAD-dependent epimerase/dehydratase family protein [Streptomyces sp. SID5785]
MRAFVTGATGWIGSAVVDELLTAGHQVVGLARSDAAERTLAAKGATALRGDLDDLSALRRGATEADAVLHLANKHDWSDPAESDRAERAAVTALGDALTGSDRPFLVASALSRLVEGRPATEADVSPAVGPDSNRGGSENLALDYAAKGVRSVVVRFAPSVHGRGDWGFVNFLTEAARKQGVSGHVGDGSAAWSAVHRTDAARLMRLGIEQAPAGSRLHAVAEEAVSTKEIAEAIGRSLGLPVVPVRPEDAAAHFGFVGGFFASTMTATSDLTRQLLSWKPAGPTLVEDIDAGAYTT